jgi:hypothetical protein
MDIAFGGGPGVADYVSWWPGQLGGDVLGGPGNFKTNYVDDRDLEGQEATAVVDLTSVDIWAMKYYWAQWKQKNYYSVLTDNCAKAVADLLYEGAGKFSEFCSRQYHTTFVWFPSDTYVFARNIVFCASEIDQNRNSGLLP